MSNTESQNELAHLNPPELWSYFGEILCIPRISKKEDEIRSYLLSFADKYGLESHSDEAGNVLISKPATSGLEDRKAVVLQSHMDMVGEKNKGVAHDFDRDPIRAQVVDGWLKADNTTLGADDGIGIAASLAILGSESVVHGPLECLFTADEESGMTGALGLKTGFIKGSILLNLDSEDEGEIYIGCAGGMDTVATLSLDMEKEKRPGKSYRVSISGLKGGHSGDEIHKGLGNSLKILNGFILEVTEDTGVRLSWIEGGNARNAIPREARAWLSVSEGSEEGFSRLFDSYFNKVKQLYSETEPDLKMSLNEKGVSSMVINENVQKKLLRGLDELPHGAISMSRDIEGLVETSTNLASVSQTENGELVIVSSQRSSSEKEKDEIRKRVASVFTGMGAIVRHSGGYPGWKPDMSSEILAVSQEIYRKRFGKDALVKAIHAGLECGLFLEKYPELDMISFGPTIKGAHTPEERIEIESVEKFWIFLLDLLKNAPLAS